MTTINGPRFLADAATRLAYLEDRLATTPLVSHILTRLFSDADRQRAGQVGTKVRHLPDIWAAGRGQSRERAIVELARQCNLLYADEDERLLRELGESDAHSPVGSGETQVKPVLDTQGVLWLGSTRIRTVQLRRTPTKVERLFRAFQASDWSSEIGNPFHGRDVQYLYDAVALANQGLEGIRITVRRRGEVVAWSLR
jgi:hypothetical protein